MHITTKTSERNTKNKSFKKARCSCNGKIIIMYLAIPKCSYFVLHIQFRPGQECAKCNQIAALNKNADDFITLCLFITVSFENVYNFYFIHLRSNSCQHLNSQLFVLWSKQIRYCSPTFQFHLPFINASTILLSINMIDGWGKYLLFIKLFTVRNNYLP